MLSRKLKRSLALLLAAVSALISSAEAQNDISKDVRLHNGYLESLMKQYETSLPTEAEIEKVSAYIKQHPQDPDPHVVLARAYNKLGMDGLYTEELEKAWRLSPSNMLYLLAALKGRVVSNDPARFISLVDEAYHVYNKSPLMLAALAESFQKNDENRLAVRFMTRALELEPDNISYRSVYCTSLMALKRYKEVLATSTALRKEEESSNLADLIDGTSFYQLNKLDRAAALLERVYRKKPFRPEIAEAYFDVLNAMGKDKEAVEPALMAIAVQPLNGTHLKKLKDKVQPVIAGASVEDLSSSMRLIESILPRGTQLAYFYFAVGDILDRSNRYWVAQQCFTKGLEIDNYSLGRAHMRLARDMEITGSDNDAMARHYEIAEDRSPEEDKEVKARRARMEARSPVMEKDLAGMLKVQINRLRYGVDDPQECLQ